MGTVVNASGYNQNRGDLMPFFLDNTFIDDLLYEFNFDKMECFSIIKKLDGKSKFRYVIKVNTINGELLVIRINQDKIITKESLDYYVRVSNCYNSFGINVPVRYSAKDGKFFVVKSILEKEVLMTIENYINGKAIENFNLLTFSELGSYLGKMHLVSEIKKLKYGFDSTSGLFLKNDLQLEFMLGKEDNNHYNACYLVEIMRNYPINQCLLDNIWNQYIKIRKNLKRILPLLPKWASQADYITNNILFEWDGHISGVIDFHMAGDMVLANDLANSLIYFGYEIEKTNLIDTIFQISCMKEFIKHYELFRPLSCLEKVAITDILKIGVPFLRMRIDKIVNMVKAGDYQDVNKHLEYILVNLQNEDSII